MRSLLGCKAFSFVLPFVEEVGCGGSPTGVAPIRAGLWNDSSRLGSCAWDPVGGPPQRRFCRLVEEEARMAISEVSRSRQCSRSDGSTEADHAFAFMAVEQEPAASDGDDAAGRLCSGYRMAVI